jgi:hypothetical protein
MKTLPAFLVITAALLAGCATGNNIETWKVLPADPLSGVGHGAFLDAQGKEITPSPEFVSDAQRYYLKRLYLEASPEQQRRFKAMQSSYARLTQSRAERVLVNAALIHWLVEEVQPRDRAFIGSKNTALMSRFVAIENGELLNKENGAAVPFNNNLIDLLRRDGLIVWLSTTSGNPEYPAECRRAGVPLPPDWGTDAWKYVGPLNIKFISAGIAADLYVSERESPKGLCFALPRSSGDTISLLGIICLGTETSKSCFWDNQEGDMNYPIKKDTVVPITKFASGGDLLDGSGGICTDCHAGENPYIVHPGEPMDMGSKILPKMWSEPLVHPLWPQNQGPSTAFAGLVLGPGDDSCTSCHSKPPGRRFPEVSTITPNYCSTILPQAISRTMPPGSPGNNASYMKQKDALQASCNKAPSTGVVVNGATQADPSSGRVDITGDLSACTGGPDCPIGFCYWRTIHGPFWQKTPSGIPIGDPAYRGGFARIFIEGNGWKYRLFVDPTGGPPVAAPGGTLECVNYVDIVGVPDQNACFVKQFAVTDPDGSNAFQSVDATLTGTTANVLSGFIGNVAQTTVDNRMDTLRVFEALGKVKLEQSHYLNPPPPLKPGPLTGESFTNGCTGWTPVYEAKDLFSNGDVQLVSAAQAGNVRCYITGIAGAWSSTRDDGKVQPFAEIYKGGGGELRLRVSPADGKDRVGAFASCIKVK